MSSEPRIKVDAKQTTVNDALKEIDWKCRTFRTVNISKLFETHA